MARALAAIHPDAIILVEGEIWRTSWRATALETPLFLINARLSDRSYPRYRRFGFLFRRLFASFTAVGVRMRLMPPACVKLVAAPKACMSWATLNSTPPRRGPAGAECARLAGGVARSGRSAPLLVAGSTHADEGYFGATCSAVARAVPRSFLVLVPRHFRRAGKSRANWQSAVKFLCIAASPGHQIACSARQSSASGQHHRRTQGVLRAGRTCFCGQKSHGKA